MRTRKLLAACLVAALAPSCRASGTAGADPFSFLFIDAGARSVAMGGAYTALANDANALLYNPAGLGLIDKHQAAFMHNQYFTGVTQEYMGYAAPQGWGVNLNYLNFGTVQRTSISNPDGSGLGSTGLTDAALSVGYGQTVAGGFSLGAAGKYISESIAGVAGRSPALDLGALYAPPALPGFSVGAALQNIGPAVKFQGAAEPLPLNARAGAAYAFDVMSQRTTVSIDAAKERTQSAIFGAGTEMVIAKMMPIRLGFTTRNNAGLGLTAGVGWFYENVAFDFAFVPFGDLGTAAYISATVRWGAKPKPDPYAWKPNEPETFFEESDLLVEAKRYEKAERALERARLLLGEKDRRWVAYNNRLARIAFLRDRAPEAKALYLESLRAAQAVNTPAADIAGAYWGLARCLDGLHDAPHALRAYKKALEVGVPPEASRLITDRVNALEAAPQ